MGIEVVYQNVAKENKAQHVWMENCRQKEVDISVVGEVFINKRRHGRINITGYELVTELRVTSKLTVYWKVGIGDVWEVIMDEDREIGIKCSNRRVIGIYGKGDDSVRQYDKLVDKVF